MRKLIIILTLTFIAIFFALNTGAINVNEEFSFEEFDYDGMTMPYRLYVPKDYSEENEYPMVVFLHGAGERGNGNDLQLKNAVQRLFDREDGLMKQSIVIAPQCPEDEQWVDTLWEMGNYSTDTVRESDELQTVLALIENIEENFSIDSARIYAMGISMGGFGTWDLIIRHNDIFAAAVPMCGGGDPSKASLLLKTPIYTFHGTADDIVPFEGTEEMVNAIKDAGGSLINFIAYEGAGHGIWEKAAAEDGWLEWLFSQKLTDRNSESEIETQETESETATTDEVTTTETEKASSETITNPPSEKEADSFPVWIIAVIVVVVLSNIIVVFVIVSKKKK